LVLFGRSVSAYRPAVLGVRQRARYGFLCYGVPGRRSKELTSHAGPIPIAILRAFNTALIFSWWRTVRDTCDGGSGTDTAAAYEIRLNIP
jgi:hypothetical protein